MRALDGAVSSSCSNNSESWYPTPTISWLSFNLLYWLYWYLTGLVSGHWISVVLQQFQLKEDSYRAEKPVLDGPKGEEYSQAMTRSMETDVYSSRLAIIEIALVGEQHCTQLPVEPCRCSSYWKKDSLLGHSDRKVLSGHYQGREVATLSFPSLWLVFGGLVCREQCDLMPLCWVMTNCVKLLAMIFIFWGRSMMSRACGKIWPTMATLAEPARRIDYTPGSESVNTFHLFHSS